MRGRIWPLVAGVAVIAAFLFAFSGRFLAKKAEEVAPPRATIAFHAPEQLAEAIERLLESFREDLPHIDVRHEPLPNDVNDRRDRVDTAGESDAAPDAADGAGAAVIGADVYALD